MESFRQSSHPGLNERHATKLEASDNRQTGKEVFGQLPPERCGPEHVRFGRLEFNVNESAAQLPLQAGFHLARPKKHAAEIGGNFFVVGDGT